MAHQRHVLLTKTKICGEKNPKILCAIYFTTLQGLIFPGIVAKSSWFLTDGEIIQGILP